MSELMRIPVDGGGYLYVELSDDEPGVRRASRSDGIIDAAVASLEQTLSSISQVARTALHALREVSPNQVEIEFGVRLNAELGAVIAKSEVQGHMRVKLVWKEESEVS